MHEFLPLSWTRIHGIRPVYRDVILPFSRICWITYADIPHDYSLHSSMKILQQNPEKSLSQIEHLMVSIASSWKHAYDFEGMYHFKNKFASLWRPVMLCTIVAEVESKQVHFAVNSELITIFENMMQVTRVPVCIKMSMSIFHAIRISGFRKRS